jgi:hypothetical protein
MNTLRLGILGISDGNGHPYSWSAIFNGYNPEVMAECPFPVIPEYLARQQFPADAIADGHVTHIWTQDRRRSEHIAAAARIDNVVDDFQAMIGHVDAVLLARDDAEQHYTMARPFLEAGLPIFIDKPVALNRADLDAILALEQYPGQVFSCSALRYARELHLSTADRAHLGVIQAIAAVTPKKWQTYAAHIIEPVLLALGEPGTIADLTTVRSDTCTSVSVRWSSGVITTFTALGPAATPIQITVYGTATHKTYTFADSFAAFRSSLEAFIAGIRRRERMIPHAELALIVEIIERGAAQ